MTSDRRRRWPLLVVLAVLVAVIATVAVRQATAPTASAHRASGGRVVLDENFDGGTLDASRWNTCHWWDDGGCTIASNNELEWYRPEQVTVADGTLRLTAAPNRYEASDGETYEFTSGMVTTGPTPDDDNAKVAITYGTVEARFKAPAGRGLWPAIWLLPASKESRPEIDLLEMIGQDPERADPALPPRGPGRRLTEQARPGDRPRSGRGLAHGRPRLDRPASSSTPSTANRSGPSPATRCRPSRCTW